MTDKLLPCPFCGGDEISHGWQYPQDQGHVQCHDCDAVVFGKDEDAAIAAWNRRAPASQPHVPEVVADGATTELVRNAYELAAQVAERDADWTAFGKRDIQPWENGIDSARDYRLGIVAGRAIAAAIRALATEGQP